MNAPRVPEATLRRIVELATRAPSVHNTQPWQWRGTADSLELYADRSRQLTASDPEGRNLTISLGAALHHAEVAADALGWSTNMTRLPDPERPDLMAVITWAPAPPSRHAHELLTAIADRCTDRRRFTSWPVPDERLTHLAAQATSRGARALPLTDVSERFRAERLVNRAIDLQRADRPVAVEQEQWINHSRSDGVPSQVLPVSHESTVRTSSRFATGRLDDIEGSELESSDGLIVVYDVRDEPATWLRAGEGLSAMWLAATRDGLSMVPLSHVVEVNETREALQMEVLGGLANPLILVRIGWQPISRSQLARTPRRPVDEVLELT
jgi:nitroreductase